MPASKVHTVMNYVPYISGYGDNKATWPIAVSWTRSAVGDKIRKKKGLALNAHLLYTRSVGHKILLTAS